MCMSTLVTTAHRVIFNCLSSLGMCFHAAFLKGKEGLDIITLLFCMRTKFLPRKTQPAAKASYGQASSVSGNQQHEHWCHLHVAGWCKAEHGCTDLRSANKDLTSELQCLGPESLKMDRTKQQCFRNQPALQRIHPTG